MAKTVKYLEGLTIHKVPYNIANTSDFKTNVMGKAADNELFIITDTPTFSLKIGNVTYDGTSNVSAVAATESASGLMSASDKKKLDGIANGANKTTVDSSLSASSTNPVQNKAVKTALDGKAGTAEATTGAAGLMSAADKTKLVGIETGANKTVVDAALDAGSTNPVQNKAVKAALDGKAGTAVATTSANGLMSAADKTKLDGIEEGTTRVIVDDAMSGTSTNPVQNKVVKKYIDDRGVPSVGTQNNTMLIQVVDGAYALRTKESIFPVDDALDTASKNAVENGVIARSLEILHEETQPATSNRAGLMSASDYIKLSNIESGATKTIVDATLDATSTNPVQNKTVKTALDGKASTAEATTGAAGLMSAADKTKLDGVEDGANKITVDAALDAESENPVQNKAVKAALDGKLDKTGGTLTGNLRVTGALFSGDGLSFGTGENIHFTKAADDAGKLAHGAVGADDTVPLARLKVATPTEDDDAATKAYVDNNAAGAGAVRYDAAQTLDKAQQFQARKNIGAVGNDSPQFQGFVALAPANETLGSGVGLSPTGSGHNYTLDISDVDEGNPTLLTGVKTPTDADTNAAATVEYVMNKVASGGSSDFVVNGTLYSSGFVSLDKTFTQVQAAIQEGKQPVAKLPYGAVTALLPLVGVKENQFIFGTTATAGDQNGIATLLLSSNGEATFDASFSPVLDADGYLPQISMGAAPTSDMQIATKKYVDDALAAIVDGTEVAY